MAIHVLIDLAFLLQDSIFYSFSVSLHVAFLLVLSLVWLSNMCKERSSMDRVEHNNFSYHKLTFCTSVGLCMFYLLFFVFSYLWSCSDSLIEFDVGVRATFWFLFSCSMQFEFGRLGEKRFPVLLRLLFGLFLLISLCYLVLHLLSIQNNVTVGAHLWVLDIGSVFMAFLLNYAGCFGMLTNGEPDSLLQEPLLNRTGTNTSNSTSNSS